MIHLFVCSNSCQALGHTTLQMQDTQPLVRSAAHIKPCMQKMHICLHSRNTTVACDMHCTWTDAQLQVTASETACR